MPDKKDEYILFSSNYSSQFVDTPLWLGPALMKPTQPLPLPPKDQETVAFFFTQVNMTADGGSMHSKQCWVRSATSYHNLTVDSQGFVMNGSSVTTPKINSNAPAGDQYRLNKFDSTSIATSFEELNAYLQSRVFFQEEDKAILDAERGSLVRPVSLTMSTSGLAQSLVSRRPTPDQSIRIWSSNQGRCHHTKQRAPEQIPTALSIPSE
jgi:hypothetical protein